MHILFFQANYCFLFAHFLPYFFDMKSGMDVDYKLPFTTSILSPGLISSVGSSLTSFNCAIGT